MGRPLGLFPHWSKFSAFISLREPKNTWIARFQSLSHCTISLWGGRWVREVGLFFRLFSHWSKISALISLRDPKKHVNCGFRRPSHCSTSCESSSRVQRSTLFWSTKRWDLRSTDEILRYPSNLRSLENSRSMTLRSTIPDFTIDDRRSLTLRSMNLRSTIVINVLGSRFAIDEVLRSFRFTIYDPRSIVTIVSINRDRRSWMHSSDLNRLTKIKLYRISQRIL